MMMIRRRMMMTMIVLVVIIIIITDKVIIREYIKQHLMLKMAEREKQMSIEKEHKMLMVVIMAIFFSWRSQCTRSRPLGR